MSQAKAIKGIVVLFWFLSGGILATVQAGQPIIDSLEQELNKSAVPELTQVNVLNKLAWLYLHSDPQQARKKAARAYELAKKLNDRKGQALSLKRLGTLDKNQGEYAQAMEYYQQALALELALEDTAGIASAYNGMGIICNKIGAYDRALNYYLKYMALQKQLADPKKMARAHTNIGNVYLNQSNYTEALRYYLDGLNVLEQHQDSSGMAGAYNNLGNFYDVQQQTAQALQYYQQALKLYQLLHDKKGQALAYNNLGIVYFNQGNHSEALLQYQQSLQLKQDLGDEAGKADILNHIALVHQERNEWAQALRYFQQSLAIRDTLGDLEGKAVSCINLGRLYHESGDNTYAVKYLKQGLETATHIGALELAYQSNEQLANLMEKLGKPGEALRYQKQKAELKDQLYNEANSRQTKEIEARFETEKMEQTIALKDVALEKQQAENRWLYALSGVFVLLIIALILGIYGYRSRQQTQQLMVAQQAETHKQQVKQLLQEQEIQSIHAMLEGQEQERKRIARDLHDRLGSLLATIKYLYSNRHAPENPEEQETRIDQLIDEACDAVRKVAHNVASSTLSAFGLEPALRELIDHLRSGQQINVQLMTHGLDQRLDRTLEVNVYRMVQELLSNVLRHAQADQIIVNLTSQTDGLNIMVEDNGIGFDLKASGKGMGLASIRERVESHQGQFTIDTIPGRGTTVMIDLPYSSVLTPIQDIVTS